MNEEIRDLSNQVEWPKSKEELIQEEAEHECEFTGEVDCDICPSCKEHTGICEECGATECCG